MTFGARVILNDPLVERMWLPIYHTWHNLPGGRFTIPVLTNIPQVRGGDIALGDE